jgi:hypothetical protein
MIVKELFDFVWEKIPWWLKWPVVIVFTPTALVLSFISWHSMSIHATIRPYEEKRDIQIKSIDQRLGSMDKKLDILIERVQ